MCCTCSSNIIIAMRRTRTFVHVSVIRECIIIYLLTVWFTCRKRSLLLCFLLGVHPIFLFLPQPTMDVATMLQSVVFMHFVQNNRETYQAILFSCRLPEINEDVCWIGMVVDTWMDGGFLPLQRMLVLGSVVGEGDVKRARTH